MPHKQNQKGFAAIETVLIIVIVAMIAGIGYYVWHSNQQAKATLDAASKSAQSSPAKVSKGTNNALSQSYLRVEEFGIRIPLSNEISDAYYVVNGAFGVKSLDSIENCKGQQFVENGTDRASGVAQLSWDKGNPTASGFMDHPNAVRVGDSWYEITANPGCKSSDATTQQKIEAIQNALIDAGKHAIKI